MGIDLTIYWPGQTFEQEMAVNRFGSVPTLLATWLGPEAGELDALGLPELATAYHTISQTESEAQWIAPRLLAEATDKLIAKIEAEDPDFDGLVDDFPGEEDELLSELRALAEGARQAAAMGIPKVTLRYG